MKEIKINGYLSVRLNDDEEVQVLLFNKVVFNIPKDVAKLLSNALSELSNQ